MKLKNKLNFRFLLILVIPLIIGLTSLEAVFAEKAAISSEQLSSINDNNNVITDEVKDIGEIFSVPELKNDEIKKKDSKVIAIPDTSSHFTWGNLWQKQTKFKLNFGPEIWEITPLYGYKYRSNVKNSFIILERGDTVFRWEDYGRHIVFLNEKTRIPQWYNKMKVYVKEPSKWQGIPTDMTIDPTNGYGMWEQESMATEQLMFQSAQGSNLWTVGGYLVQPKNYPTKTVPLNNWVLDDIYNGTMIGKEANPIIFDFVEGENIATNYAIFEFDETDRESAEAAYGASRRLLDPQVVKAQYRDIDTGEEIKKEDIYGKDKTHLTKIEAKAEPIEGYTFDHYETVSRLKGGTGTLNKLSGPEVPEFDVSTEEKTVAKKGEETWNGELRTAQQGVVFYYKENQPKISLDKKVDKENAYVGDTVSYQLDMLNKEGATLLNPHVYDILPEGVSEPEKVRLDDQVITKGSNGSSKPYYEWNTAERKLDVYYDKLSIGEKKDLKYDVKVLSGKAKEVKRNTARFTGSNTNNIAYAYALFTILNRDNKAVIHVKQEVIGKHDEVVVPTTGYINFDQVKANNTSDQKNQLSSVIPSYESDTKMPYKDIKLKWNADYTGYQTTAKIPEFYQYDGYQLTINNGKHVSSNKKNEPISLINIANEKEYWLTIYIKPKIGEDGPPFYNWDYATNDFAKIDSEKYFDWESWQKDPVFNTEFKFVNEGSIHGYDLRNNIGTFHKLTSEGDTILRLEDYGRQTSVRVSDHPINIFTDWYPEMDIKIEGAAQWKNIPQGAYDSQTKEAKWSSKMALNSVSLTTPPSPITSIHYIGAQFLTPETNPPLTPLDNLWITDDKDSNFNAGDAKSEPIIFDFVDMNSRANIYVYMETNLREPIKEVGSQGNRRFLIPKVVKVQYRDIDTGKQITSEGDIYGIHGRYRDSVTAKAKSVSGYTLDHYEYVDETGNHGTGNKGVDTWKGELTTTKKGIVFWYKK